jgi:hypothetical protein
MTNYYKDVQILILNCVMPKNHIFMAKSGANKEKS